VHIHGYALGMSPPDSIGVSMETGISPQLGGILQRHGKQWQLGLDEDTGMWTAVQRPSPTAVHVIVARTLGELAVKLDEDTQ